MQRSSTPGNCPQTLERVRKDTAEAKEEVARREALEERFQSRQLQRTIEIVSQLSGGDKDHVQALITTTDMTPPLAKAWRGIDGDLSRVAEMQSRMQKWIADRCKVAVLQSWGEPEDRDFDAFAESQT